MDTNTHKIGVISDTHGLLRPEAAESLNGSSLIIHAGDIGRPDVLDELKRIAPVIAVRGNVDTSIWCQSLPLTEAVEVGQTWFYILHEISRLDIDPVAAGFGCVIFGHSHQPSIKTQNGIVFLNPGAAGPRRFNLPVSVAMIEVAGGAFKPQLIELKIQP